MTALATVGTVLLWILISVLLGVLALLVLLVLLTCCSVRLHAEYRRGRLKLHVWYLLLRFDVSPEAMQRREEKRVRKEAKRAQRPARVKKKKDKPPEEEKESKSRKGFEHPVATVWGLLKSSRKALRRVLRSLTLYRVRIHMGVGSGDAHRTALAFSRMSLLVQLLLGILGEIFTVEKADVFLFPDFTADHNRYDLALRARIRPIVVLVACAQIGIQFLKTLRAEQKKKPRRSKKKLKQKRWSCT